MARLRELALVRAMEIEMQTASQASSVEAVAAEAARAVRCGESGNPCKLRMKISQVDFALVINHASASDSCARSQQ